MIKTRSPLLLLSVTFTPILILCWIFYGTFELIEIHLQPIHIKHWNLFAVSLISIISAHLIFTIHQLSHQKKLSFKYAIITIFFYGTFLFIFLYTYRGLLPHNVPGWLTSEIILLYALGFILPTIIHSLSIIVMYAYKKCKNQLSVLPTKLLITITYSVILYHASLENYLLKIIIFISAILLIVYYSLQLLYSGYRHSGAPYQINLLIKLTMVFALPATVITINSDVLYSLINDTQHGLSFIVLACVNGIALCLPNANHPYYRLILFTVRSMTFFVGCFQFIAFGINLPLSIPAVVGLGMGMLIISPVCFLIGHPLILSEDFNYLKKYFSSRSVFITFLSSFMSVPLFFSTI